MTNSDDAAQTARRPEGCPRPPSRPSTPSTAQRKLAAGADFDALRTKAADAVSALYREGREHLVNSEELANAKDQLS